MEQAKKRIKDLTDILTYHSHQYYVLDNPQMPDFEYDRLLRELEELEAKYPDLSLANSPTKSAENTPIHTRE